jgi:hypothetical protein
MDSEEYLADLVRQKNWFESEVEKALHGFETAKDVAKKEKYRKQLQELLGRLSSFKKELENL